MPIVGAAATVHALSKTGKLTLPGMDFAEAQALPFLPRTTADECSLRAAGSSNMRYIEGLGLVLSLFVSRSAAATAAGLATTLATSKAAAQLPLWRAHALQPASLLLRLQPAMARENVPRSASRMRQPSGTQQMVGVALARLGNDCGSLVFALRM